MAPIPVGWMRPLMADALAAAAEESLARRRGWLLVHAAKRFERNFRPGDPLREILDDEFGGHWAMDLPTGAIIGRVLVTDCVPTAKIKQGPGLTDEERDDIECGDYAYGRFAWRRSEYERFAKPIPWRGLQGLFDVPDDALPDEARRTYDDDDDLFSASPDLVENHASPVGDSPMSEGGER